MKEAYKCKSADKARKRLQALVSWLERNGYDEAAGSLREGMEETLTVVKLALPELLHGHDKRHRESQRHHPQSLEKRQAVEELPCADRLVTAEKKFHRIKYRHMGALARA